MRKDKAVGKIACLFAAGIIAGSAFSGITNNSEEKNKMMETGYRLRLEGKSVNVYEITENGEKFSGRIEEINIFDMPEESEKRLKEGMEIQSRQELEKVIEEMTS